MRECRGCSPLSAGRILLVGEPPPRTPDAAHYKGQAAAQVNMVSITIKRTDPGVRLRNAEESHAKAVLRGGSSERTVGVQARRWILDASSI